MLLLALQPCEHLHLGKYDGEPGCGNPELRGKTQGVLLFDRKMPVQINPLRRNGQAVEAS